MAKDEDSKAGRVNFCSDEEILFNILDPRKLFQSSINF